jgi:hypothetical protein
MECEPRNAVDVASRERNHFVRQILEQSIFTDTEAHKIVRRLRRLALIEPRRARRSEERASARVGHHVHFRGIALDEATARVVQQNERLIVVVLKTEALPLVRHSARDRVHLRPSSPPQDPKTQEGMLPDRPTGVRQRDVARDLMHPASR